MDSVYPMRNKSDSFEYFKRFHKYAENHSGSQVTPIIPIGSKYCVQIMAENTCQMNFVRYLAEHGIHHQLTVAYTPQQNGVAERMNRTLMNLVRSMLHHKKY